MRCARPWIFANSAALQVFNQGARTPCSTPTSRNIRRRRDGLEPRWGGTLAETRAYLQFLARRYPKIAALKWFGGYEDYVEGYELLTAERYDQALARFDRALSFDDQYPYYHYGRALALYMLARDSEAAETLEPALAAELQEPAFLEQMAKIRYQQLRPDDALATVDKALAFDPYNPDALRFRAQMLAGVRRYAEAVRTLDDALVYGVDDPRILTERSEDLLNLGRYPDALAAARQATELAPDYSLAWLRYTEALYMTQDCQAKQALQVFRAVCKNDDMCGEEAKRSIPGAIPMDARVRGEVRVRARLTLSLKGVDLAPWRSKVER